MGRGAGSCDEKNGVKLALLRGVFGLRGSVLPGNTQTHYGMCCVECHLTNLARSQSNQIIAYVS